MLQRGNEGHALVVASDWCRMLVIYGHQLLKELSTNTDFKFEFLKDGVKQREILKTLLIDLLEREEHETGGKCTSCNRELRKMIELFSTTLSNILLKGFGNQLTNQQNMDLMIKKIQAKNGREMKRSAHNISQTSSISKQRCT